MSSEDAFRKRLVVRTGGGGLSCTLTILPGRPQETPSELEIAALLTEHNIAPGRTDKAAVVRLRERALEDPSGEHSAVIATGIPAEDGTHGDFRLAPGLAEAFEAIDRRREHLKKNPDAADHAAKLKHTGGDGTTVDYREQSAFVIVHKGDLLGEVTDPTTGSDGVDVHGEVIPAKGGHSLTVARDTTTSIEEDRLIATTSGRLIYGIDRISVQNELEIAEDVDFATGNIDFPGNVVIHGGVKDQFHVRTMTDLRVDRLIEAADLDVGRDATLGRGMAGRGDGTLRVGRDLHAHYLDGVTGEVGRDCVVVNEIKECTLQIGGAVRSPACTFYGGTITAIHPVELGTLGSAGGAETAVEIGPLNDLDHLIERLGMMMERIDAEREHSATELKLLNDTIRKLTPTQAERLTELQFTQIQADEFSTMVVDAAGKLLDTVRELPTPRLSVAKTLHKGVRVRLGHHEFVAREAIQGPCVFELDQAGKPRCTVAGSNEPKPIEKVLSRTGNEKPNPLVTLTEYANRLSGDAKDAA